jgi:Zn-dependent protease
MVSQTIRIGKIFGIEIGVNYSWFIVFGLVTVILAAAYFPEQYQGLPQATYITWGIVTSLFFFISVLLHELAHSLVARMNNIPIKSITLFIFGGVSNMTKEPDKPSAEFLMALAGPLASFVLATVFGIIALGAQLSPLGVLVAAPAQYLAAINLLLGIFNLVPGFPLDGGRVLRSLIWHFMGDLRKATRIASIFGQAFAAVLIALGLVLLFASQFWPNGIWFIFIGLFLYQMAGSSYQDLVLRGSLAGVTVRDLMTGDVKVIDDSLDLMQAVNEYFMRYKHGRFPVTDENGNITGIVTLHQVRDIPRDKWPFVFVKNIATPLDQVYKIKPDAPGEEILEKMAQGRTGHLLVMEDGVLVGIVTKSDVLNLMHLKARLGV